MTDKNNESYIFLNEKHALLSSNLVPTEEHCIFRALKFRPSPLLEKGTSGPLLIQSVTLSKPLATSIFIETHDNRLEKFGMPNL